MAKKKKKQRTKAKKPRRRPHHVVISKVLEFLRMGYSIEDIANGSGPQPDPNTGKRVPNEEFPEKITVEQVRDFASKGLSQIVKVTQLDQLKIDLDRINAMMSTQIQSAMGGDSAAIAVYASLMDRRAKIEEQLALADVDFFSAIKRTKMGRPPHVPTDETRLKVRVFKISGWTEEQIAEHLDVTVPTLRKWYTIELDRPEDAINALAVNNIVRWLREGDKTGTIFYMKTRLRWSEGNGGGGRGGSGGGDDDGTQHRILIEGGLPAAPPPQPVAELPVPAAEPAAA